MEGERGDGGRYGQEQDDATPARPANIQQLLQPARPTAATKQAHHSGTSSSVTPSHILGRTASSSRRHVKESVLYQTPAGSTKQKGQKFAIKDSSFHTPIPARQDASATKVPGGAKLPATPAVPTSRTPSLHSLLQRTSPAAPGSRRLPQPAVHLSEQTPVRQRADQRRDILEEEHSVQTRTAVRQNTVPPSVSLLLQRSAPEAATPAAGPGPIARLFHEGSDRSPLSPNAPLTFNAALSPRQFDQRLQPPTNPPAGQTFRSTGQTHQSTGQPYQPTGQTHQLAGQTHQSIGQTHHPTGQTHQSTSQTHQSIGQTHHPTGQIPQSTGQTLNAANLDEAFKHHNPNSTTFAQSPRGPTVSLKAHTGPGTALHSVQDGPIPTGSTAPMQDPHAQAGPDTQGGTAGGTAGPRTLGPAGVITNQSGQAAPAYNPRGEPGTVPSMQTGLSPLGPAVVISNKRGQAASVYSPCGRPETGPNMQTGLSPLGPAGVLGSGGPAAVILREREMLSSSAKKLRTPVGMAAQVLNAEMVVGGDVSDVMQGHRSMQQRLLSLLPSGVEGGAVRGVEARAAGSKKGGVLGGGLSGRLTHVLQREKDMGQQPGDVLHVSVESKQLEAHLVKCRCTKHDNTGPSLVHVFIPTRDSNSITIQPGMQLRIFPPWKTIQLDDSASVILAQHVVDTSD